MERNLRRPYSLSSKLRGRLQVCVLILAMSSLCVCCCANYTRRTLEYLLTIVPSVQLGTLEIQNENEIETKWNQSFVPCQCQFGDYVLTGLSNAFHWCACDANTTLLAKYEQTIREAPERTLWKTVENYMKSSVVIRKAFYDATLCSLH